MNGCFGGCLGRVFALLLLVILVVAAWRFGPELGDRVAEWRSPAAAPPSPDLAERAEARYHRLVAGELDRLELTSDELESLLRHRLQDALPPGVRDPSVEIREGEVRARLRVASELLPDVSELEGVRGLLPDTVPVEMRGVLVTLEGGHTAFIVRRVDAAGIPVPRRFHGAIASAVNPIRQPGFPEESVEIPLPAGVRSVHIEDDRLVLLGGS